MLLQLNAWNMSNDARLWVSVIHKQNANKLIHTEQTLLKEFIEENLLNKSNIFWAIWYWRTIGL